MIKLVSAIVNYSTNCAVIQFCCYVIKYFDRICMANHVQSQLQIHSFHWHVHNVTIPCRSQELLPFLLYISLPSTASNIHQLQMFWDCFTGEISLVRRVGAESRNPQYKHHSLNVIFLQFPKLPFSLIPSFKTSLLLFLDFFFFFFLAICNCAAACKKKTGSNHMSTPFLYNSHVSYRNVLWYVQWHGKKVFYHTLQQS